MLKVEIKTVVDPLLEGIKQFMRVGFLATIPVAIEQLGRDQINWRTIILAFVIAVLVGLEKAGHEQGKITGEMNPVSKVLELKSVGE